MVDLASLVTNKNETLLNLPGKQCFFATRPTDLGKVNTLIQKLHPVVGTREVKSTWPGRGRRLSRA